MFPSRSVSARREILVVSLVVKEAMVLSQDRSMRREPHRERPKRPDNSRMCQSPKKREDCAGRASDAGPGSQFGHCCERLR